MKKNVAAPAMGCLCGLLLLMAGCDQGSAGKTANDSVAVRKKRPDAEVVMSVLYQQQAAAYRALCLQAYNIAKSKVLRSVNQSTSKDSFAVITDLDETALDNSADEAQLILDSTTYPQKSF